MTKNHKRIKNVKEFETRLIPENTVKQRIIKLIITTIAVFLLFNTVFFGRMLYNASNEPINKEARAYLHSAEGVNVLYIIPLTKTFGFDNILTVPFYSIRDYLYQKGLGKLKPDDGEREYWWWRIRFNEFYSIYVPFVSRWEEYTPLPTNSQFIKLKNKENEVYNHIKLLIHSKPYDKTELKDKYYMLTQSVYYYTDYMFFYESKYKRILHIDINDKKLHRLKDIYEAYESYKEYARKYESEGVKQLYSKPNLKIRESLAEAHILRELLESTYSQPVYNCDSPYMDELIKNQYKLLDYLYKYGDKLNVFEYNNFAFDLRIYTTKETEEKCKKSNSFQKWDKYADKLVEFYNHK